MHIADITMFHAPTSGGVRSYLVNKHRFLAQQAGVRHSIVVPGKTSSRDGALYTVPAMPLGSSGYRLPLRGRRWTQLLTDLRPDLIEAGDPYRLAWVALEAGRRLGVPVVGFYHSDLPRLIKSRFGVAAQRVAERYVRSLYSRFTQVLAPSRVMARQLQALGVERVSVQPLGVDTHVFHPNRADPTLRERFGIAADARILVFAGRAAREKNIPLLIDTAQALGDGYHLLLIGPGMPQPRATNVTTIDGYMSAEDLARHMAACDALMHAGPQETFGLVVLEAMASGLPVIGIRDGAVPELVVPGTGVLAVEASCDGLVEATRTLFRLDAAAMGRRARRHVEAHYAWERTLAAMLGHYRQIAGSELPRHAPSSHAST